MEEAALPPLLQFRVPLQVQLHLRRHRPHLLRFRLKRWPRRPASTTARCWRNTRT
jgi:hypothetical protein